MTATTANQSDLCAEMAVHGEFVVQAGIGT